MVLAALSGTAIRVSTVDISTASRYRNDTRNRALSVWQLQEFCSCALIRLQISREGPWSGQSRYLSRPSSRARRQNCPFTCTNALSVISDSSTLMWVRLASRAAYKLKEGFQHLDCVAALDRIPKSTQLHLNNGKVESPRIRHTACGGRHRGPTGVSRLQ